MMMTYVIMMRTYVMMTGGADWVYFWNGGWSGIITAAMQPYEVYRSW